MERNSFITHSFDVSNKRNILAGTNLNVFNQSSIFGFLAIVLAAINIFGGFLVTQRMLAMYKKKKKDKK